MKEKCLGVLLRQVEMPRGSKEVPLGYVRVRDSQIRDQNRARVVCRAPQTYVRTLF